MSIDGRAGIYENSNIRMFEIPKSSNPTDDNGLAESFKKVTTAMYVSLAPCFIQNPLQGVKTQHLDPMLMMYKDDVKGVVISYSNIKFGKLNKITGSDGQTELISRIEGSSPFTFMWISVDLLVWAPQRGDIVEGHVYMQTAAHIGLLIHDTFNASIKKYNIPKDWTFVPSQRDDYSEDTSSKLKSFGHWVTDNETNIEGKLRFTIKSIHTTGRVVSVEGTLIEPGSELEFQPIFRERGLSASQASEAINKHTKFEDDAPTVTEIVEPTVDTDLPDYTINRLDEEGEAIVNDSDSNYGESD